MNIKVNSKELQEVANKLNSSGPNNVKRAATRALNKTSQKVRTDGARAVKAAVQPRRGAARAISSKIKRIPAKQSNLVTVVKFSESGIGIEQTAKASVRKVRGSKNKLRINFRGKQLKGFRLGSNPIPFIRARNKIKRAYSFTALQEASKAKVFEKAAEQAPAIFTKEFRRQLCLFE